MAKHKHKKHPSHGRLKRKYPFNLIVLLLVVVAISAIGIFIIFRGHAASNRGAGYDRMGFYPCDMGATQGATYAGAQQVQCYNHLSTWLGRNTSPTIPFVTVMMDSSSPDNGMDATAWGETTPAGAFQTLSVKPTMVVSVPLAFGSDGCGLVPTLTTCFDKVAAGNYTSQYQQVINYFHSAGYDSNHLIIRLGWEYDGTWQPWSAINNPSKFVAAFRRVHDDMRAVAGYSNLKFDLAGDAGQPTGQNIWDAGNRFYPGDAYVDIIGMDTYYEASSHPSFSSDYQPSLTAQENFAKAHGKTISYPEWGQKQAPDTPSFIQNMGNWFNSVPASGAGSLEYQTYFNTDSHDVESNGSYALYNAISGQPLSNNPNTEATFKTLFGGSSTTTGNPAPNLTSLSPTSGTATGGTMVTLSGTNFVSGATISFGGSAGTSVVFNSASSISVHSPAHAAGAVDVVVTNPDGQSDTIASGFTYNAVAQNLPDLIVTSIGRSPASATVGNTVTFSATVKNQGTAATPTGIQIGVAFAVDGGNVVNWSDNHTTSLAVGASVTLTANSGPAGVATWTAVAGPHTLEARVDDPIDVNRIAESNESNNRLSTSFSVTSGKAADFNNSGTVDISDLSILAAHFNQAGVTKAQGDATGDGNVDVLDLSVLATQWGT